MGLKGDDIAKHNNADSCWVIVHVSYEWGSATRPWAGIVLTLADRAKPTM